ncbi:unnamed protein product [Peronospora destructor]|uniref:Uncharacterized protein n=1 Tax=Peronospora destructor TaxID=86335 RepID=A0AAV0T931_9STRA|nr:unnamed protein product [Peronospora destructor]
MPNSNRGLIGLPLKPVQSRNALALSAIQEERASLDIVPQATAVATTTSSSPCGTSPTTVSSSNSNSSPIQSQPADSLRSAPATIRACSVAKLKDVQSAATRMSRVQSARANSTFMTNVKAQKSVKPKGLETSSERTRSVPCFDEPTTTAAAAASWQPSPRKVSQALLLSCLNDSLSVETVKQTPKKRKQQRRPCHPVHGLCRPLKICLHCTSQEKKEGREPRMVGTRTASDPTAPISYSKSSSFSPSDEQWTNAEALDKQRGLTMSSADEKGKLKRPKSFTKFNKQNVSPRSFPSKDENSLTCERASSFNGSKGRNDADIPILELATLEIVV